MTRSLEYDVSVSPAQLTASYVFVEPTTSKGKAIKISEWHHLDDQTFLALARDGKGNGDSDNNSKNKNFYIYSTAGATNIAFTNYTTTALPVAKNQAVVSGITAAKSTSWIDMINEVQLERFGLCEC